MLIHPARGIAVLDILPTKTADAAGALRARLAAARFPAIFAGHLPVVHLQATPRQMPFLPSLLDDAFAAQPPLRLPGGDAWVSAAMRALTSEQPVPRLESQRFRSVAGGRRHRRAAGLRTAGAVLLCLAALGGVLGLVLRGMSAPEPGSAPTAPAAAAAPALGEATPWAAAPPAPPPVLEAVPTPPQPPAPLPVETAAPLPQESAPPPPPAEVSPASPQRAAAPSPPRPEAGVPPPARRLPEKAAPRRRQETTGAASTSPEAAPQRCSRITALVGLGAPLSDGDMRFFNETCVRW